MFNFFSELKKHFALSDSLFSSYQIINLSNKFLYIEGHKGVLNFSTEMITFKVKNGVITVQGKCLYISEISNDTLAISGEIKSIEVF